MTDEQAYQAWLIVITSHIARRRREAEAAREQAARDATEAADPVAPDDEQD